jgi:DNA polymerase-3 subunit epsilon
VSPSLYGFVHGREPVGPEEIAAEFLSLPHPNGDARSRVERLVSGDPRFVWDGGYLRTADPTSLALEEAPYVVFDVETTGPAAGKGGAITEFGALKLVGGVVVDEFSTLVNPGRKIDPFVVRLTGITDRMVAKAPPISEVMPRFEEFVEGSVLVGHNVHFDCSFVTASRGGVPLPNPVLDTLKLARCLVPGLKRYKLSALVSNFDVREMPNHRALSDAAATTGVFLKLLRLLRSAGVQSVGEAAMLRGGRSGRVKPQKQYLAEGIPETPGVYYFVNKHGTTLYVGKAKNLRARVRTYFNGGDGRRKVGRLVEEVAEVRTKETASELYALILEAREIKRLLPRYNSVGREEKASWFIRLDLDEPYPIPERVSENGAKGEGVIHLGPYRSAGLLDTCIDALGRIFPLRRCSGGEGVCFYGQMGRCAPCAGMDADDYRTLVIDEVVALLRGEGGEEHLAALIRERERLATGLEFEAAARLRDLIAGIERIRLARAVVSAEGVQAVVAPSTEPGVVEVFVLSEGRLIAHKGFETGDLAGLSGFAEEVLAGKEGAGLQLDAAKEVEVASEPEPLVAQEDSQEKSGEPEASSPPTPEGGVAPENLESNATPPSDETRVVAAYLRRRSAAVVDAVRLGAPRDLLEAVGRVAAASGDGATPLS